MRTVLALLASLTATLLLVELGAIALVRGGTVSAPRPHHGETGFWWHHHPEFGAWHHPDTEGDHNGPCYKARYEINAVGARDVDRPERAPGRRVVVLGDSFLEGYGLDADSRFSDMLEVRTGVPHLNFAMASFGPYQQLLVYRSIAKKFDHDAVIVSLFPGNDFADMDPAECQTLGDPDYCFRPFPVLGDAGLAGEHRREPRLRSVLRQHSQAWNLIAGLLRARSQEASELRSGFYDFDPGQVDVLEAVLDAFVAEAEGRPVIVLLIAKQTDLGFRRERGSDPLSARLEAFAAPRPLTIVNLLPGMAARSPGSWDDFYLSCDFHWNRYGNRVATDLFLEALPDWAERP